MNIWHDIREDRIYPTDFMAVIEIQKGSNKKYELDKETGMLYLERILFTVFGSRGRCRRLQAASEIFRAAHISACRRKAYLAGFMRR